MYFYYTLSAMKVMVAAVSVWCMHDSPLARRSACGGSKLSPFCKSLSLWLRWARAGWAWVPACCTSTGARSGCYWPSNSALVSSYIFCLLSAQEYVKAHGTIPMAMFGIGESRVVGTAHTTNPRGPPSSYSHVVLGALCGLLRQHVLPTRAEERLNAGVVVDK